MHKSAHGTTEQAWRRLIAQRSAAGAAGCPPATVRGLWIAATLESQGRFVLEQSNPMGRGMCSYMYQHV